EVGTLGAQAFAAQWPKDQPLPRSVLVGEPTSLKAVRMHKGHLTLRLTLKGVSAHSGSPHLGLSAIEPAGRIIQGLSQIQKTLVSELCDSSVYFPEVPHTVLNVTTIEGGTAINIIPDSCVMHISIRLLPGQTAQPMVQRVDEVVAQEMKQGSYDLVVQNESPPMLLDEHTSIHRELCDLLGQQQSYGVNYASDGGPFQAGLGMESVLCGPGTIDVAHKPNESLPIDEFQKARPLYEQLIERMCVS
ncbi:MAG: M20/M25/M40 family metallo-hydrolase, partial [Planctomycetota bacterium]|nr:M20/M25/M40 family metallo-hydrolase [Planctomycetota bacterium]